MVTEYGLDGIQLIRLQPRIWVCRCEAVTRREWYLIYTRDDKVVPSMGFNSIKGYHLTSRKGIAKCEEFHRYDLKLFVPTSNIQHPFIRLFFMPTATPEYGKLYHLYGREAVNFANTFNTNVMISKFGFLHGYSIQRDSGSVKSVLLGKYPRGMVWVDLAMHLDTMESDPNFYWEPSYILPK